MRIGFDAKRAFRNTSGLGNHNRSTVIGLKSMYPDHEYVLYSPKPASVNFDVSPFQVRYPTGLSAIAKSLWRSSGITSDIKRDKIDVYHGLSHELPRGIHKTKVKSVVTMHDAIFLRFPELYKKIDVAVYTKKWKHACVVADHIIAISQQTKSDLIEFLDADAHKISVVYQDCDQQFRSEVSEDEIATVQKKYNLPPDIMLAIGTVEERKNILAILKAMVYTSSKLSLVCLGKDTKYRETLDEFIRSKCLGNRVRFIDNASFTDFPALYRVARMLVYPSKFEGFGLPIIESMWSGTPVITTEGGVFSETGGDAAKYVKYNDHDAIVKAIDEVHQNTELREIMIAKGKAHVQKFKQEIGLEAVMNIYQRLVHG